MGCTYKEKKNILKIENYAILKNNSNNWKEKFIFKDDIYWLILKNSNVCNRLKSR